MRFRRKELEAILEDVEILKTQIKELQSKDRFVKVNTDNANYLKCEKCEYSCKLRHELKIHLAKSHPMVCNDKVKKCDLCDKTFALNCN